MFTKTTMTELTDEEKQYLAVDATKAIEQVAKLYGLSLARLPKIWVNFLIGVFVAGAGVALNQVRKEKEKKDEMQKV